MTDPATLAAWSDEASAYPEPPVVEVAYDASPEDIADELGTVFGHCGYEECS